MKTAPFYLPFAISLTTVIFATRYALAGLWLWAVLIVLLAILWWVEFRQRRPGIAQGFLTIFVGFAIIGIQKGLGAGWMFCGLLATLSAWDLHHFSHRLAFADDDERTEVLIHNHLRRLLIVTVLGGVLGAIALTIRITLNFGLLLFLAILTVVCVSQFVKLLRQESD